MTVCEDCGAMLVSSTTPHSCKPASKTPAVAQFKDYDVIRYSCLSDFLTAVRDRLKLGWIPVGGVSNDGEWVQAMVLPAEAKK